MPEEKFKTIKVKFSQYILLLFFFFLLMALAIIYGNKMIEEKITAYKNKEAQKIALEDRISNLNKLETEYKNISNDIDLLNQILPSKDKLIDLVAKVENIASQNKVDLTVDFEAEPKNHVLQAKLIVKGYYNDVFNFYKNISNDSVLSSVKNVKLTDANNLRDNTKAEFGVEVYFD